MVSQAKVIGSPSAAGADPAPGRHSRGFAHDAIELCELQLALLRADLGSAVSAGRTGGALMLAAGAVLFAAAPLLLLALAVWMETATRMSMAACLLASGLVGAGVGAAVLLTGWTIAKRGAAALKRSQSECQRNLAWLKETLAPNPSCRE